VKSHSSPDEVRTPNKTGSRLFTLRGSRLRVSTWSLGGAGRSASSRSLRPINARSLTSAKLSPDELRSASRTAARDSETKLVISYYVGKRDHDRACNFIRELSARVASQHRHQINSDGLRTYIPAIEEYFGADVDYAQLIKVYGRPDNAGPEWYGPGKVIETVPTPISGDPDPDRISTSHIELSNLSIRMHLRRFTPLVNAFSK
jgi:hypothetical protein